ncbi:MAG TPA: SpoIIE family protein phosphatase [Mycobacterium sp.]|nr:SpoIIE family protein phosphatase [Mycobacterium sp.]
MVDADFYVRYADALRSYLSTRDEGSLAVGHELGRRALREQISMLDIIEHHFVLVDDLAKNSGADRAGTLPFLLQTLTALDFATRGFLDGTKRYEQQRARAETLAHRDEFRSALVNSLQEGFFVAADDGAVVEVNDAFTEITGYPAEGLPYRWPHPWLVERKAAAQQQFRLEQEDHIQYETPIRHRSGYIAWVTVSVNTVTGADREVYVGTIRDITAQRAFAARESAVLRLATAVSVAKNVDEVLSVTLDECRTAIDVQRVVAVGWPTDGGDPTVETAGEPAASTWSDLDPLLHRTFQDARRQLPLTVQPVEWAGAPGQSRGFVAVVSGAGDVALWLEFRAPRRVSAQDRLLVTALVGQLSLGLQHVRQFEAARDTSLTLQRAMLPPGEPPAGFAVRYEPAVSPLEIGGDWYDVLPISGRRIGIIVGDCVGRGLSAAAVMGQLRSSARALLLTGAEPAMVLEQLDAVAALIPDAFCTTAFVAILDIASTTLRYSCAGHLPAVLTTPESGVNMLADACSVPLAVQRKDARPDASRLLTPGSTLVFYTDGLVERRGETIDAGIARVGEIVRETMTSTVDAVADALVGQMAPSEGYDDDVAIVVYRCPPSPLHVETDAVLDRLADVRHRLSAWLGAANIPAAVSADIVLAVNEACENSVEHAYPGRKRGKVRVMAEITDSRIQVRVADSGSWEAPPHHPGNRGRGLPLIRAVTERFDLDHSGAGTTANMSFRIPAGSADGQPTATRVDRG